jgi:signal transduction histidine kinase
MQMLVVFTLAFLPLLTLAVFVLLTVQRGAFTYPLPDSLLTLAIVLAFSLGIGSLLGDIVFVARAKLIRDIADFKSDLIALALHQFNAPLVVLRWTVELLDDQSMTAAQRKELLESINHTTERLVNISHQLSSIDATLNEQGQPNIVPVNLRALARDLTEELGPEMQRKKITLRVSGAGKLPQLRTDPILLRQILHNLLTNAIKYTTAKGKITLAFQSDGQAVTCRVTDTGKGIPTDEQDSVFRYGFRARNVRGMVQGSGLGLHLSRIVTEFLGGRIGFQSKENAGTTFWVILPLR